MVVLVKIVVVVQVSKHVSSGLHSCMQLKFNLVSEDFHGTQANKSKHTFLSTKPPKRVMRAGFFFGGGHHSSTEATYSVKKPTTVIDGPPQIKQETDKNRNSAAAD